MGRERSWWRNGRSLLGLFAREVEKVERKLRWRVDEGRERGCLLRNGSRRDKLLELKQVEVDVALERFRTSWKSVVVAC